MGSQSRKFFFLFKPRNIDIKQWLEWVFERTLPRGSLCRTTRQVYANSMINRVADRHRCVSPSCEKRGGGKQTNQGYLSLFADESCLWCITRY